MDPNNRTFAERRKYIRLPSPIKIAYLSSKDNVVKPALSKNISAEGIGFSSMDSVLSENELIDITLDLADTPNPIHAKGRIVWKRRLDNEDGAPYDVGVEFIAVDEDNKNSFLKYLCDLLYSTSTGA